MKHREKLFKLLRECVETPQESFAVEEMILKVSGDMLPIETVSETQKKFGGLKFYKNAGKNFCCTISIHRFVWTYFNGEIPDGCEIHHRDFNHDNNDIANLELVTKDEHQRIHAACKKQKSPPKKSKFTCAVCGREYEAVRQRSNKYCSAECRYAAGRKKHDETRVCLHCGKEFSAYEYGHQKFCSRECLFASMRKHEDKICPICGKQISVRQSRNRKYCSQECYHKARQKNSTR